MIRKQFVVCALVTVLLTSSCSGEEVKITPCMSDGQLAFRLGEVAGWMGIGRVRPKVNRIEVFEQGSSSGDPIWSVDTDGSRRSLVIYGEHPSGWTVNTAAQQLTTGRRYTILLPASFDSGSFGFRFGDALPSCDSLTD